VTITAAFVLFMVIWFLVLFVVLPIGVRTQAEDGRVVPGTPGSAPSEALLGRKFLWVTLIALVLWAGLASFIVWGGVSVRDIDVWGRM
jgi:predicted secreted protein